MRRQGMTGHSNSCALVVRHEYAGHRLANGPPWLLRVAALHRCCKTYLQARVILQQSHASSLDSVSH